MEYLSLFYTEEELAEEIQHLTTVIKQQQARITMLSEDLETHEKVFHEQQAEIERLNTLAELGQLAVELLDTEYCFVPVMRAAFINGLNSHCEGCAALKICRKRAELRVAE